ncbi:Gfo/Idh/MocA family oxidoreductase [Polaromonas sp. P1(28)-13]|nr:Gfo/Idh/MocA family oxidoreductase [Polaromonas sp. P1(28)-13]
MTGPRIGVVGAGVIGMRHIAVLASDPRAFTLVAVADPAPAAEAVARSHGVPWFADYRQMLDACRLDGVVIASPNKLHTSTALTCLDRKVAVLIEKPIADTLEEALRVADASRKSGVPVSVGHHRRHNPLMTRAREFIDAGELGRMVAVVAFSLRRKNDGYFDMPWRREKGGGPLLINGIHEIDNLRMLCGEIDSVQTITSNATRGLAVEDTFAATLKFRNGALGTLTLSDAVQAPWDWNHTSGEEPEFAWEDQNSCMVCGTEASLAIPSLEHWRNENGGGRGDPCVRGRLYHVPADPVQRELLQFMRVIRGEEPPLMSAEEAGRTLACVLAMGQSAATGQWVNVDELYACVA